VCPEPNEWHIKECGEKHFIDELEIWRTKQRKPVQKWPEIQEGETKKSFDLISNTLICT
jgi:hypothetical protein